jgi:hypothetical protein
MLSHTQSRPRSSIVNAIGCTTSGSAANSVARDSLGSFIRPAASPPARRGRRGRRRRRGG